MDNPAFTNDVDIDMDDVDIASDDDDDIYNTPKYYQSRRRRNNTNITNRYINSTIKTTSLT